MPVKFSRFDSADYLQTDEDIADFLEAALEEAFESEEERIDYLAHVHATAERARERIKRGI